MSSKKRVTGIGGIFFKCKNQQAMHEWYSKHLGLNTDDYGTSFEWRQAENPDKNGYTVCKSRKSHSTDQNLQKSLPLFHPTKNFNFFLLPFQKIKIP